MAVTGAMDIILLFVFLGSLMLNGWFILRHIEYQAMLSGKEALRQHNSPNTNVYQEADREATQAALTMDALMWYDS